MSRRKLRYRDLPDDPKGAFCWCAECDERFSACKGDYFWADQNAIVSHSCGADMRLVRETRTYVDAHPGSFREQIRRAR